MPTMGALHDGHVSLIKLASQRCDQVAVSIFVNPLQFNRPDDFETYPRTLDDDLAACEAVGVDAVYAPTPATMYPRRFQTHVDPGPLAETMEGAARPGHFRGVTTVVTKLLTAVRPDVAVFGEKDFQQLTIIRRMVEDLDLGLEIVAAPTVREPDGLAMSSRNTRLSPDDRIAARCVPAALAAVADAAAGGEPDVARLLGAARDVIGGELHAARLRERLRSGDARATGASRRPGPGGHRRVVRRSEVDRQPSAVTVLSVEIDRCDDVPTDRTGSAVC